MSNGAESRAHLASLEDAFAQELLPFVKQLDRLVSLPQAFFAHLVVLHTHALDETHAVDFC